MSAPRTVRESDPDWDQYRYQCESCGERSDSNEPCPACGGDMRKRDIPLPEPPAVVAGRVAKEGA